MKKLVIISLLFLIPILGVSQSSIVGQKAIMFPEKYLVPNENVSLLKTDVAVQGVPWVVYSDCADNYTIEKPNSTSKYKKLSFLEKFYVLEENDKYIHLIKDTKMSYDGLFSSQAEDYGYVKKDNLLLWNHCLLTVEGKINKKAIIINTFVSAKSTQIKKGGNNTNIFFENPQLTIKPYRKFHKFEIFYIYKITDKTVLLGRNPRIPAGIDITDIIEGWISKNRVIFWDHRMALEPNWNLNASEERKFNNIKATVLTDILSLIKFGNGEKVKDKAIIWNNDSYDERKIGDWMRFPILKVNENENYYHVGVFGEINSESYSYAYAPINVKGLKKPLFQRVLLLSKLELGNLILILNKLSTSKSSGDRREYLVELWIEILQAHLGGLNEEELLEMNLAEINNKIFGLSGTSGLLRDVKLKYLNDPSIVDESTIGRYIMNINIKFSKLSKIFNSANYKYSFRSNNETYYWIPEYDIP
ncbi:MAG: hypothetical protein K8R58_04340 [Bacteroidales bacterium]|nr:hypothetical protein [Bacteroidales bacterium]